MAIEVYIPAEVSFRDDVIDNAVVFTLYDPDTDAPRAALTAPNALDTGARGGPLIVVGTRGGKRWRVTLPEIEVVNHTALGCEFRVHGRATRDALDGAADQHRSR